MVASIRDNYNKVINERKSDISGADAFTTRIIG